MRSGFQGNFVGVNNTKIVYLRLVIQTEICLLALIEIYFDIGIMLHFPPRTKITPPDVLRKFRSPYIALICIILPGDSDVATLIPLFFERTIDPV